MTHFFKVKLTYKSFHIFCLVSQLIIKEKRKERGDFIIEKSFVPSKQLFALCKLFFSSSNCSFFTCQCLTYNTKMVFCYQNCSDQLWEKNVLAIEIFFWNSRLKTNNLQTFWDHKNNLFKQLKVRTIFATEWFSTFNRFNTLDRKG